MQEGLGTGCLGATTHLGDEGLGAVLDLVVGVQQADVARDDLLGVGRELGAERGFQRRNLVLQQGDGGVGVLGCGGGGPGSGRGGLGSACTGRREAHAGAGGGRHRV